MTTEQTKQRAEELILNFTPKMEGQKVIRDMIGLDSAIISVENTIGALNTLKINIDEIGRPMEIDLMIEIQQQILEELKSRL